MHTDPGIPRKTPPTTSRSRRAPRTEAPSLLCESAVAAVFKPLETARGLLLAVSGGPDSMALMLLAAAWRQRWPQVPIHVATVDHRLRPDSTAEAEQVAVWAKACGLPHTTLVWDNDNPKTRVQERARQARYALLSSHARSIGADHVVTAHHADDQAETILFRLLRGSGPAGLAGMAPGVAHEGLILARPLLHLSKAELIAVCTARNQPFFTDPSNANPAYARTRLRRLAGTLAEHGLDRTALLRLGRRVARADAALDACVRAAAERLAAERSGDAFKAHIGSLASEPEEIVLRVLADEITTLIGADRPLRLDRLEALTAALLAALRSGQAFAGTLGGTLLRLDRHQVLTIRLENGRRRGLQA